MTHAIKYRETYERIYFVQADTFDEACEKLEDAIQNGLVNGPYICSDSEYINDSERWNLDYLNKTLDIE